MASLICLHATRATQVCGSLWSTWKGSFRWFLFQGWGESHTAAADSWIEVKSIKMRLNRRINGKQSEGPRCNFPCLLKI